MRESWSGTESTTEVRAAQGRTHLSVIFQRHVVSCRADAEADQTAVGKQARTGWKLGEAKQAMYSVGNLEVSVRNEFIADAEHTDRM